MIKEEILKIAKEYDLIAGNAEHGISTMGIVNFAILIANYEREACAKLLEKTADEAKKVHSNGFVWIAIKKSAELIRARGQE